MVILRIGPDSCCWEALNSSIEVTLTTFEALSTLLASVLDKALFGFLLFRRSEIYPCKTYVSVSLLLTGSPVSSRKVAVGVFRCG